MHHYFWEVLYCNRSWELCQCVVGFSSCLSNQEERVIQQNHLHSVCYKSQYAWVQIKFSHVYIAGYSCLSNSRLLQNKKRLSWPNKFETAVTCLINSDQSAWFFFFELAYIFSWQVLFASGLVFDEQSVTTVLFRTIVQSLWCIIEFISSSVHLTRYALHNSVRIFFDSLIVKGKEGSHQ